MAAPHHPATPHPPTRVLLLLAAAGVIALLWTGIGALFAHDSTGFPTAQRITATPTHSPPGHPPASAVAVPSADARPTDDRFLATVAAANPERYPRANRDEMILAGRQVCAMVSAGRSVTDASRTLVMGYGFSTKQARAVGLAAVGVYCPENRP